MLLKKIIKKIKNKKILYLDLALQSFLQKKSVYSKKKWVRHISFFYLSFLNAFYKLFCDVACKYYLIRQLLSPNNSSLLSTSHWDAQSYLASGLGPLHFSGMLVLAHSCNWLTVWFKSSLVTSYRNFSYHPTGSALINYSHSESLFCVPLSLSEMDEFKFLFSIIIKIPLIP